MSHRLNERRTLNVANCTTQLDNTNIRRLVCIVNRDPRDPLNPILNGVCEVRHNLHRFPKIVAATFTFDYVLVDLASCDVVLSSECDVEVALVVSKVEVDFTAIIENKNFTMPTDTLAQSQDLRYAEGLLCRCHSTGIDIHVRIDLN